MLTVLTEIIERCVADAFNRLFGGVKLGVGIMYSSCVFSETRVQLAVQFSVVVLSYHVFKYSRICSCKKYIENYCVGNKWRTHITNGYIEISILTVFRPRIKSQLQMRPTRRGCGQAGEVMR